MHSPVRWVGGKSASAKFIIQHFPDPVEYESFVDVFGGGANILLNKPRYKHYELYNDLDSSLVNFWRVLRDHTQELIEQLESLPYSYALYKEFFEDVREDDAVEHAVRWFYLIRSNFKPRVSSKPDGWRSSKRNKGYSEADAYRSAVASLHVVVERLRGVEIDCRDYTEVLKRADTPKTVFYCDPPYIEAEGYYNPTMRHDELASHLNALQGKVILSYYDHPDLSTLYPGWNKVSYTKQKQLNVGGKKDYANEVLLFNY